MTGPSPLAVSMLNMLQSALEADPAAVHALMCNRVPCNQALADHPYVICDPSPVLAATPTVGALGLLNGFLCALGQNYVIGMGFQQDASYEFRERMQLTGFVLTPRQAL